MTTSQGILKWLDENKEWFKPSAICKKLKIDKGNFSRYMKSEIPEKYLIPIMGIIMPLGFTLDEVYAENNKPEVKARILSERNSLLPNAVKGENPLTEKDMTPPPNNGNDINNRIEQIQKELKTIPNNLKIPKKMYISIREKELTKLKSEIEKQLQPK